ncbi:MAG: ABC transporter ATP-binding protein [Pseudomonadota bacterium]
MLPPILEAQGLTKSFGGFRAVNDVSLTVATGSIHGLIGPNGAGKTTLFNLLTKLLEPTSGTILFQGANITALPPYDVARLGIVRSFQISSVFPELTPFENICIALQRPQGLAMKFWRSDIVLDRFRERCHALLVDVGLKDVADRPAGQLPYGEKRALEIATTLALEPTLLLLDEPMAGLNHSGIDLIVDLIRRAAENRTVIMVEHNLGVVERLCDKITVLQSGQVLTEGDYATVASDPRVIEAYIGGDLFETPAAADV